MKSAFLVGPKEFELREVAEPAAPPDGLVLEVEACGVCGSDLRRWREGPAIPYVPGHEVVGVVIEVGPVVRDDVPRYAVGDRLAVAPDIHCGRCYYCARELYNLCDRLTFVGISPDHPGGFAERMAISAEVLTNGIVHPMPAGLSFLAGSLSEPCSSVLACHHKAGTSLDDTVVVIGAGPIGCLHISIARARGARVIVSQRSAARREMVRRFRPDAVLDPTSEDVVARVQELTGGVGADLVICANPVAETQAQALEMVRKGGRVVLFGGLPRAHPMVTLNANRIHYGDIELVGAFSYHPIFHAQALDVLGRGLIPVDLLVTHTFPLEQVAAAFETADSGEGLKVVVSKTPSRLASRT